MAERVTDGERIGYSPEVGWEQWSDGAQWRLKRGEDFQQDAHRARRAFLSWASRRGVGTHSSVSPDGETLVIQVVPRGQGDEAAAEGGLKPGTYIDGVRVDEPSVPVQRTGESTGAEK